jgi:exopolysaccharide biosynthesis polyprenyl glycosylphosphotransferase
VIRFFNAYFPARTVFLGLTEMLLATLAFLVAMVLYLGPLDTRIWLSYERGGADLALVLIFIACSMYFFDLYDSMVLRSRRETFTRLTQVLGVVCLLVAAADVVFPSTRMNPRIFLTGTALAGCLLLAWRRLFLAVNSWPALLERVLVLGDGRLAHAVLEELQNRPELGFQVVCHLTEEQDWNRNGLVSAPACAQELRRIVRGQRVQSIVVALGDRRGRMPVDALLELKKRGVRILDGAELYEVFTGKVALESLRPSALLFSHAFQISQELRICKRLISLLVSAVCLALASPLMALIAVAIRLDSPGAVIFRQKRIGKDGKPFTLYKFRSMKDVAENGNHRPAAVDDERTTRVGHWLRATRLDETPQLWNILRGDMHFVGPRPFVPDQEEICERNIPFYRHRWAVKPGATGWAQVNRGYCATLEDNAEKLAYDLFYVKHLSLGLDILIIFKTVKSLLLARGAR